MTIGEIIALASIGAAILFGLLGVLIPLHLSLRRSLDRVEGRIDDLYKLLAQNTS